MNTPHEDGGPAPDPARTRTWVKVAWASMVLAAACALIELTAGPLYRWGWLSLSAGIQALRLAATAAAIVAGLALLGAALAWRARRRESITFFLASALTGVLAAAPPAYLWLQVQKLPRIHDISTDTANPPRFVAVLPLRQGARNPADYNPAVADLQRQGYADLMPLNLDLPAPQAFARAEKIGRAMGWEIVAAVPSELRIEATATSVLFGFKDDIVIRVSPQGNGSRIDLRSLSRVGGSDFGANANRIRKFIKRFRSDADGPAR